MSKRDSFWLIEPRIVTKHHVDIDYAEDHYMPHMKDIVMTSTELVGYEAMVTPLKCISGDATVAEFNKAVSKMRELMPSNVRWSIPSFETSVEKFSKDGEEASFEISKEEYNLLTSEGKVFIATSNGKSFIGAESTTFFMNFCVAKVHWEQLRSYHPREIVGLDSNGDMPNKVMDLIANLVESTVA